MGSANQQVERWVDICAQIVEERKRQDEKWGRPWQNPHKRTSILTEEVGEVAKAALNLDTDEWLCPDDADLLIAQYREELIQVAAVAVASIECLDRGEWDWNDGSGVR